jgi:hypothetical protein
MYGDIIVDLYVAFVVVCCIVVMILCCSCSRRLIVASNAVYSLEGINTVLIYV